MNNLQVIETNGMRVLTTKQIAEVYETDELRINHNYGQNKDKYKEGKHYIVLKGEELRQFKNHCRNSTVVGKRTSVLYLWTEKGALLHAKSINTDKAWEVYDYLVDFYFRKREVAPVQPDVQQSAKSCTRTVVDAPDNPKILGAIQKLKDDLTCMSVLLDNCKMYVNEEEYIKRQKAATDIFHIIMKDCLTFSEQRPNLVQKRY